jgi:avirulence protein
VARWPDPKYNNEDSPSQQWYGRSFWKATRKIGRGIADGSITSLAETWQVATSWRSARANPSESNLFSLARKDRPLDVYSTPLVGEYSYIKDRYSQRSDGELEPSELPGIADSKGFTLTDEIDGQPVTLTSIVLSTDTDADRASPQYSMYRDIGMDVLSEPNYIRHTDVDESQRVVAHAESLFSRIVSTSLPHADTVRSLGELHWWLANAAPDERGSAAKAELSVRSIAQSRSMDLPPFKKGVVPDLEAITTPRSEFTAKYPAMFDWKSASWRSGE